MRRGLGVWIVGVALVGCAPVDEGTGEGPGHRAQELGLTPEQELQLGRQAYREILSRARGRLYPPDSPEVRRVVGVGRRIAEACEIEPLRREINLHIEGYIFEWEFNVIADRRVNAFCLPGGKVAVYAGLLAVAENDSQLAAVIGHEIAHALAHHASERVAWTGGLDGHLRAAGYAFQQLSGDDRDRLISALGGGGFGGLAAARRQESEADHIGLFLMAFAGYDPWQAVDFWARMRAISADRGTIPEILSDHPSDGRRMAQLQAWAPQAEGAFQAYREGRVAPASGP